MKWIIKFKTIRARLIFWLLIVAVLPLSAASIINYQQRVDAIKENSFQKLMAIRDLKVDQLNLWLNERINDLEIISENLEIRAISKVLHTAEYTENEVPVSRDAAELLNRYLEKYKAYEEIFIVNPNSGKTELSTNKARVGIDHSQNQNFTEPMQTKNIYIKDIYYSRVTHRPSMTFSIPIYDMEKKGDIAGILVARINLELSLYDLLLDRTGMGDTGETLIVDKDGIALNKLKWYKNAPLKLKITAKPVLMASQGRTGITETLDYRGEPILAAYTYIPRTQWGFVAKQDLKEVYASVQEMFLHILIVFAISVLFVCLLAFFVAKNFTRPIHEITQVSRRMQKGDLSVRTHILSEDELGFLAQSFNYMARTMESQTLIQKGVADLSMTMVAFKGMQDFTGEFLKKLIEITGSNLGAFHLLTEDGKKFKHAASIGISPELLEPFDAAGYEGELGKAVAAGEISWIRDIPEDTVFKFKTFTGTLSPKEIITIPITSDANVVAVISLAGFSPYSKEVLEILKQTRIGMDQAFFSLIAGEKTQKLAEEMGQKNQELETQSVELQFQAEELQQTTDELQEQNVELGLQGKQIEKANRLKSEFLSNMSHELRTPLNSVMALSRVLIRQAQDKLSDEELNYLKIIARNGENLLAMINDILDLAKIEAGNMDINLKLFQPGLAVETIMERLEPIAEEKGIKMHLKIPDHLPQIESDEVRVQQILQNLIGNAIKFTRQGSVTASVLNDEENIHIEIADTGIGITNKDLPQIFKEFRQADGSSTRPYEGTGLGLTIAHRAAGILGGELTVQSVLGKGSKFTLTLPINPEEIISRPGAGVRTASVKIARAHRLPLVEDDGNIDEYPGPGEHKFLNQILLVEDNEAAVIQVKSVLESKGYGVDVAMGGREALEYVQDKIPDGIILDLMMPEVDGFEVLKKIRSQEAISKVPILILTAKDLTPEDLKEIKSNNIRQLIQKGDVGREDLLFKVKSMLGEETIAAVETRDPKPVSFQAEQAQTRQPESAGAGKTAGMATILVIEDNPDNMISMKAVLNNNYTILEATHGEEGLKKALTKEPDLILLDISLPGMDGFTVAGKLKEEDKTCHIPIIAVTASVMKGDREMILEAGCDDYMSKPIEPDVVFEKIEKWMQKRN